MLLNCGVGETLESPLDCKEIQQSILKEISPGCSLEGLMLKLKLQYFGHLMRRVTLWELSVLNKNLTQNQAQIVYRPQYLPMRPSTSIYILLLNKVHGSIFF